MHFKKLCCAVAVSLGLAGITLTCAAADKGYVYAGVGKVETPWFSRHELGVMEGAKLNGGEGKYKAHVYATPQKQAEIIDSFVEEGANALLVVPNDAKSLETSFKKAKDKGVAVITHESPHQVNADFDVELLDNQKFGVLMMDEFAKFVGDKTGKYAIYVGSLTVPAHNIWADAAVERQKEKYPEFECIGRYPVSENREISGKTILSLMRKHPDLIGVICMGSEGAPGVAKILKEKGLKDKIVVIGVTTPNDAREYLEQGYIMEACLWDPAEAAKIQTLIARMVLDGKKDQLKKGFSIEGYGEPVYDGNTLIFDKPLLITKENVADFNF